jgi:hypothetical protein
VLRPKQLCPSTTAKPDTVLVIRGYAYAICVACGLHSRLAGDDLTLRPHTIPKAVAEELEREALGYGPDDDPHDCEEHS